MRGSSALIGRPLLLAGAVAAACPICVGSAARSPAQDLVATPHAVLAVIEGQQYRVVDVVKGDRPPGTLTDVVVRDSADTAKPQLLVRDDAWPMWVSLGAIDAREAATVRELAGARPQDADTPNWQRRVEVVLPHLESRQPLLAEIAYAECASAPYAALRAAKPRLDARALRGWLADPRLAARRPLYVLLLGIAGGSPDAAAMEAELVLAASTGDAKNLAALLTADLELRGPSRVAWIEDRYLRERARTTPEITAALLALSVQGNTRDGAIPRRRVIEAYRVFMREHRDLAGLVAQDLAAWQYWDAVQEYEELLASGPRQQYASQAGIVAYLRQSPRASAAR